MSTERPFVLTIAGFDPSGGAGILADAKTFEQHQVYGLAITTGNTIQNENEFISLQWTELDFVVKSIRVLFGHYKIEAVKIGIVPTLPYLKKIVSEIKRLSSKTKIVWDPILKSTTEFKFTTIENQSDVLEILEKIDLITPNYQEILKFDLKKSSAETIAEKLTCYCPILLKGGHHPQEKGTDYLYTENKTIKLHPSANCFFEKHGSGCVLSSAITANLAMNHSLIDSCKKAKLYIEKYLNSNHSKLGYHYA